MEKNKYAIDARITTKHNVFNVDMLLLESVLMEDQNTDAPHVKELEYAYTSLFELIVCSVKEQIYADTKYSAGFAVSVMDHIYVFHVYSQE